MHNRRRTRRLACRIVRDYRRRIPPRRAADRERFRQMPNLAEAIRQAALARRADGKCESHQHRVGLRKLIPFEAKLQQRLGARSTRLNCRASYGP